MDVTKDEKTIIVDLINQHLSSSYTNDELPFTEISPIFDSSTFNKDKPNISIGVNTVVTIEATDLNYTGPLHIQYRRLDLARQYQICNGELEFNSKLTAEYGNLDKEIDKIISKCNFRRDSIEITHLVDSEDRTICSVTFSSNNESLLYVGEFTVRITFKPKVYGLPGFDYELP